MLFDQRRAPSKSVSSQHQHDDHGSENRGLFVVETLEERQQNSGAQQPDRQPPSPIEAPVQTVSNHQQTHADRAAEQMRQLEDGQRQEITQQVEPIAEPGRGAGEQQHGAREEHCDRDGLRRHGNQKRSRQLHQTHGGTAMRPQLVNAQQGERQREGRKIINGAVGHQRAQQPVFRHVGHQQQQDGLEHTDAAGDVADDAGRNGDQVDAGERCEADRGMMRQQHVQHADRAQEIGACHGHLREGNARLRHRDDEAAPAQRLMPGAHQPQIGADGREQHHPGQHGERCMHVQHRPRRAALHQQRQSEQQSGSQ